MTKRDVSEAFRLLRLANGLDLAARIDLISANLRGRPYREDPLGGGPGLDERLTVSLSAFDCVTYVESVIALACAQTVDGFAEVLRQMRYAGGRVEWGSRLHYMTEWVRHNRMQRRLVDLTTGEHTTAKVRTLSLGIDAPARRVEFKCYPKRRLSKAVSRVRTGDVMLFVSTRARLDVFHLGFLMWCQDQLWLRHAARSAGFVTEEPLGDFMQRNRMSGFILVRPVCGPSADKAPAKRRSRA